MLFRSSIANNAGPLGIVPGYAEGEVLGDFHNAFLVVDLGQSNKAATSGSGAFLRMQASETDENSELYSTISFKATLAEA